VGAIAVAVVASVAIAGVAAVVEAAMTDFVIVVKVDLLLERLVGAIALVDTEATVTIGRGGFTSSPRDK
tara:strand:+ start:1647 stop:1853 length:207 start_codon:yes stop_codon:yes gene_type:complete